MLNHSKRPPLFETLKSGLEEGIQFARGELTLRTTRMPRRPPQLSAKQITRLRRQCGMSQAVFAGVMNVSTKTVQSWEQGERTPSQAALRLLQIIQAGPNEVCQIVGIRT